MINAGVRILLASGGSWNSGTLSWDAIHINVTYPSGSGQTYTGNPPQENDLIFDPIGNIWKILSATNVSSTEFIVSIKNINVETPTNSIQPDGADRGLIVTPDDMGAVSPYWNDVYITTNVFRNAMSYNISRKTLAQDLSSIDGAAGIGFAGSSSDNITLSDTSIETAIDSLVDIVSTTITTVNGKTSNPFDKDVDGNGFKLKNTILNGNSEVWYNVGVVSSSDMSEIASAQKLSKSGNLTLVTSPYIPTLPRKVLVTTSANDSTVNYTIYYTDENDVAQTYTSTLPNATTAYVSSIWVKEITQISVDASTTGTVSFGVDDNLIIFDYINGNNQKVYFESTSTAEIIFKNFPNNNYGLMLLQLINGGSSSISWPANIAISTNNDTIKVNGDTSSFIDSTTGFGTTLQEGDIVISSDFSKGVNNSSFYVLSNPDTNTINVLGTLTTEASGATTGKNIYRKVMIGEIPVLSEKLIDTIIVYSYDGGRNIYIDSKTGII